MAAGLARTLLYGIEEVERRRQREQQERLFGLQMRNQRLQNRALRQQLRPEPPPTLIDLGRFDPAFSGVQVEPEFADDILRALADIRPETPDPLLSPEHAAALGRPELAGLPISALSGAGSFIQSTASAERTRQEIERDRQALQGQITTPEAMRAYASARGLTNPIIPTPNEQGRVLWSQFFDLNAPALGLVQAQADIDLTRARTATELATPGFRQEELGIALRRIALDEQRASQEAEQWRMEFGLRASAQEFDQMLRTRQQDWTEHYQGLMAEYERQGLDMQRVRDEFNRQMEERRAALDEEVRRGQLTLNQARLELDREAEAFDQRIRTQQEAREERESAAKVGPRFDVNDLINLAEFMYAAPELTDPIDQQIVQGIISGLSVDPTNQQNIERLSGLVQSGYQRLQQANPELAATINELFAEVLSEVLGRPVAAPSSARVASPQPAPTPQPAGTSGFDARAEATALLQRAGGDEAAAIEAVQNGRQQLMQQLGWTEDQIDEVIRAIMLLGGQ